MAKKAKTTAKKSEKKKMDWRSVAIKGMLLFMIIALILSSFAPMMM